MRRRLHIRMAAVLTAVAIGATAAAQAAGGAQQGFVSVPVPAGTTSLWSVATTSPTDAWAVGNVILHWDGTSWSVAATPPSSGLLRSVTAVSSDDAWAVGGIGETPLVEHWDGTSWQVMTTPHNAGDLLAVTVDQKGNVWVASDGTRTLFWWDGTRWHAQAPAGNEVSQAALAAPNSGPGVWLVGRDRIGTTGNTFGAMAGLWSRPGWQNQFPVDSIKGRLTGAATAGSHSLWAVGMAGQGGSALWVHWDGQAWTSGKLAPTGTNDHRWFQAVATGPDGVVWATGQQQDQSGQPETTTGEIDRLFGVDWVPLALPDGMGPDLSLLGIATIPGDPRGVWAVGFDDNGPVILRNH